MANPQFKIAPSILSADFTQLGQQVKAAEAAGADMIHFDVMDGRFVPNLSFGLPVLKAVRSITSLPLDVHLMIVEPERYIDDFADAGADIISVHVEASPHLHRNLQMIQASGCRVGVAMNPHTPAVAISGVVNLVDMITVMTVNPGFGGQSFLEETMAKITQLRTMVDDLGRVVDIEVDGGINASTAQLAVQSGANVLVAGSAVFSHPQGIEAGLAAVRSAVHMSTD